MGRDFRLVTILTLLTWAWFLHSLNCISSSVFGPFRAFESLVHPFSVHFLCVNVTLYLILYYQYLIIEYKNWYNHQLCVVNFRQREILACRLWGPSHLHILTWLVISAIPSSSCKYFMIMILFTFYFLKQWFYLLTSMHIRLHAWGWGDFYFYLFFKSRHE